VWPLPSRACYTARMHLVQLLLPLPKHGGREVFERTRELLTQRFGGMTAYLRSPAEGRWRDPAGEVEQDDVVIVEVMCEQLDRAWWATYREDLEKQLGQQEIVVRALPIETL